jgi:hypothetical protein
LNDLERDTLIFVTGSTMFVRNLSTTLRNMTRLVFALDVGFRVTPGVQQLYPEVRWRRIAHAEVGGVTSAKNWFGTSAGIELGDIVVPSTYRHSIGEVLQPTLLGSFGKPKAAPIEKPQDKETGEATVLFEGDNLVSPNGLWPAKYGNLRIVAPSVFSTTGWVGRKLDPTELGAAWDLPVAFTKVLKRMEGGKETQMLEISKVCRTAPCKSLWAFGYAMKCFGLQDVPGDFQEDTDTDISGHWGFGMWMDKFLNEEESTGFKDETGAER